MYGIPSAKPNGQSVYKYTVAFVYEAIADKAAAGAAEATHRKKTSPTTITSTTTLGARIVHICRGNENVRAHTNTPHHTTPPSFDTSARSKHAQYFIASMCTIA